MVELIDQALAGEIPLKIERVERCNIFSGIYWAPTVYGAQILFLGIK